MPKQFHTVVRNIKTREILAHYDWGMITKRDPDAPFIGTPLACVSMTHLHLIDDGLMGALQEYYDGNVVFDIIETTEGRCDEFDEQREYIELEFERIAG